MDKYTTNPSEDEVLPNKLGLTDGEEISQEETLGFAQAEHDAIDVLGEDSVFSLGYLYELHRNALGRLYDFAGRLRTVDMTRGGFMFAAAAFLSSTMQEFESRYLEPINSPTWESSNELLDYLAEMHAELLYIHPFREGNGRIIRLFTKLIFLAKSGESLDFTLITEGDNFNRYVAAVQQAAHNEHTLMKELFREM